MRKGFWWKDGYFDATGLGVKCVGEWKGINGADADGGFSHAFWVLDFSYEELGELPCGAKGEWTIRAPGIAQLVRPGTRYYRRKSRRIESHAGFIGFLNGEAAGLDRLVGESGIAVFRDPGFMIGERISQGADFGQSMGARSYWRVLGVLCDIIGLLHAATPQRDGMARVIGWEANPSPPLERSLRKYLSLNLDRHVTLKEMAKAINVSLSSLTHTYTALTGESPRRTHVRLRLEKACEMLFLGESIKSVAERLGFSDVHHFTRLFKAEKGLPPAKFRRGRINP